MRDAVRVSVSAIEAALTPRVVEQLAGGRSFDRGELYAWQGRVKKVTVTGASARGTVQGASHYRVDLVLDDEMLTWSCTCLAGADGGFCKHCVALALVVGGSASTPGHEVVDVAGHLRGLDHEALVELVLSVAENDELFAARLRLDATRARDSSIVAIPAFKDAIDGAIVVRDYVDYREAYDYATNIDSVLDMLEALLEDGHAEAVIELAEHVLARLEEAVGHVDDSDGWLGGIAERVGDIHLAACSEAGLDPVVLAGRLFEAELSSETFDVFHAAVTIYADVLGEAGVAEFGRLAEQAWARLPALGPGESEASWRGSRYRLTHMMETFAAMSGDVDAEVSVLARDLSSAWQYVRIIEICGRADRHADALEWAERGFAIFEFSDGRLLEALADEYHHADRGRDAVRLFWKALDLRPTSHSYERLRHHATRAGEWTAWRGKAIDRLRRDTAKRGGRDASELVRVYLDEGDTEAAWTEATRASVNNRLWLELAQTRESDHPADAIPIYRADVDRAIAAKNNDAYRAAVERLDHIATLMNRAGEAMEFAPYVADLRTRHKAKRNLMKLFDQRGW